MMSSRAIIDDQILTGDTTWKTTGKEISSKKVVSNYINNFKNMSFNYTNNTMGIGMNSDRIPSNILSTSAN